MLFLPSCDPPSAGTLIRSKTARHTHQVWLQPPLATPRTASSTSTSRSHVGQNLALSGFTPTNGATPRGTLTLLSHQDDPKLGGIRFVAEGGLYRIRANLIVDGWEGWAVYAGTLRGKDVDQKELDLAEKSLRSYQCRSACGTGKITDQLFSRTSSSLNSFRSCTSSSRYLEIYVGFTPAIFRLRDRFVPGPVRLPIDAPARVLTGRFSRLIRNRNGLLPPLVDAQVAITCSVPPYWQELPLKKTLLYSHQQWRAPDRHAGMGVAYFHTPVPMSPQSVIWFAKGQYTQGAAKDPNAKLIALWNDSSGRAWFEAENSQYHIRGYAMTRGFQAWIVYSGYRVKTMPEIDEIDLAERAANTVMPAGNA